MDRSASRISGETMGRPNDSRGFVHKRLFGAAKSFVSSGFSPSAAALGFLQGGGRRPPPPPTFALPPVVPQGFNVGGLNIPNPCGAGFEITLRGCQPIGGGLPPLTGFGPMGPDPRTRRGGAADDIFGEAVMGQYGAGILPALLNPTVRRCPGGTVLGNDGVCYKSCNIRNSDREWPRGRRPLLTGGEMRAISVAASAAGKLGRKTKQLQKMGMLAKPTKRKAITAGACK